MSANRFLDGFLSHGLAVLSDSRKKTYVSCGIQVETPISETASLASLNQCEAEFRAVLRMLKPGYRMQLSWTIESDCSEALLHYYDSTKAAGLSTFARRERHERFTRYSRAMEAGQLRFQRVRIYFSQAITGKGNMARVRDAESKGFDLLESEIRGSFERLGGKVSRLDDAGLFREMFRFCNPSQLHATGQGELYDPSQNLMENCLTSEGNATVSGFFMDGRYFGFLVVRSLPLQTYSGQIQHLTSLPIQDFGIAVNVVPLDVVKEIEKEEVEIGRIRRSLQSGGQQRAATALDQKIQRVQKLAANEEVPFNVQIIIRVWDETQHGLQTKIGILKSAVTRMDLAKSYAPTLPTSARNYFRASFPGWCFDTCRDFRHLVGDAPLANLLPITGSPNLGNAEALYDGANGNVIGINTFLGEEGSESPQHTLVCGKTGSGKSCMVIDLLTQTSPGYSFTVIVDNGLSYQTFARTVDPNCEPLIVKPNGKVTFNYLDTQYEPLSPEHIVDSVAVAHQMAGRRNDEDVDRMRRAVLSRCVNQFYPDFAQDWLMEDPSRLREVACYAVVLQKTESGERKASLLERHRRFNLWASANPRATDEAFRSVSDDEIQRVSSEVIQRLACAFMSPDQAATHCQFQQWLELESMGDANDREEVGVLATLLKPWCADGGLYGGIFDGPNNVKFKGAIVHLELGQIPDSAPDLRSLAALVITNQIRNEILRRPRNARKRVVFEELGSLLAIPGGEKIVREFFETMRKYNTWVCAVAQQLQSLRECGSSLLGNIRLAILMKQSSTQEIEILTKAFELPESASETLSRFPEPSKDHGAPFLCWRNSDTRPEIVAGFHVASPEMLFVSASGGGHFEQRQEALAKYDDVLEGILAESAKVR